MNPLTHSFDLPTTRVLEAAKYAVYRRQASLTGLWSYSKDYVSHRFKQEVRKVGITDARFHDLRRTFGLNLIKQGMSIYKVSKLLGHSSVRTTEQHYAPLLTVEIEDFEL